MPPTVVESEAERERPSSEVRVEVDGVDDREERLRSRLDRRQHVERDRSGGVDANPVGVQRIVGMVIHALTNYHELFLTLVAPPPHNILQKLALGDHPRSW